MAKFTIPLLLLRGLLKMPFNISISKNQINNISKIESFLLSMPNKIAKANDIATKDSVDEIRKNILKRGKPGRFINVESKKYGSFGMKVSIDSKGAMRGGSRVGGRRQYNAKIAANIFLMSEMGYRGRKAFTLPMRKISRSGNFENRYRVSHNSGRWRVGTSFVGPLAIPAIGPFHFSAQTGMPRITIKKMAANTIRKNLNAAYKKEFGKKIL